MTDQHPTTPPRDPMEGDPLDRDIDPGAFVGNRPERQAETIPGGVRPDDERIAAHSTQADATGDVARPPDGHREGAPADDDAVREAGQNR